MHVYVAEDPTSSRRRDDVGGPRQVRQASGDLLRYFAARRQAVPSTSVVPCCPRCQLGFGEPSLTLGRRDHQVTARAAVPLASPRT
jgi:hypothetical protein